tara:strand:- start:12296 stop:12685 length:390 start_codon:yes stop_codon:yes gene_type:complete
MIITDRLKSFLKPPHEVIKSKHLKAWSDLTSDKDGSELRGYLDNPLVVKFFFDTGWIMFGITSSNTCHIYSMYKHPKSPVERKEFIDMLREFFKKNKIEKITMQTSLPAEFWIDKYGFEFKANLMEIKV